MDKKQHNNGGNTHKWSCFRVEEVKSMWPLSNRNQLWCVCERECRGNWRGDDTWIWQIFLLMTQSSGTHTPKHTLLSGLLVTLSFLVFVKRNMVSVSLTNDKTAEGSGNCNGGKLWNHWNIPLRDVEASNHWHTLWRKVSWASQLGHYRLGYRVTGRLEFSCSWAKGGISNSSSTNLTSNQILLF